MPELVAADAQDHVGKAIEVANGAYPALRSAIVERSGALFDRPEPIRALEAHLVALCGGVA
jgi:hypothetical protein